MWTKSIHSLISVLAFVGVLCFAGPALAVPESEPNNFATDAGSQHLGTLVTTLEVDPATILDSDTNPFDIDVFQFILSVPSFLQLSTDALEENPFDGLLSLLDSLGVPLDSDDMENSVSLIPFSTTVYAAGTYYARIDADVVPIDEDPFTFHNNGDYSLLIERRDAPSGVPEPASLLLLGSGLVGLALWRRKRA